MSSRNLRPFRGRRVLLALAVFAVNCAAAPGQERPKAASKASAESLEDRLRTLQEQLVEMQSAMTAMHDEILRSRAESAALRKEMEATRRLLAEEDKEKNSSRTEVVTSGPENTTRSTYGLGGDQHPGTPEEDQQLINAKLDELHQSKVESASKYRVRLSGAVLLNVMENSGTVDNLDFPSLALARQPGATGGSFGATLRQSLLGLEVFGPQIYGARLSGDLQFDFAGGFPDVPNGVALGVARLRTGVVRMEWPNTTLLAGQDVPFFSPLSPSSIASLALPAFAYSGNLWTWMPQVRLERRFRTSDSSSLVVQAGILDPLSGEQGYPSYLRAPLAGEASRQPAYAMRMAWSHRIFDHNLTLGAGSFYSRQNWEFGRNVDAWAGTADWIVPLARRWELSGEFYRGRGIGGLGAGLGRSVVFTGSIADPAAQVQGLNAAGGWAQLKFRQTEKLEWNAAFGMDNSRAGDLRHYPVSAPGDYGASLARNRSGLFNFIYRPRSDLLFSVEYRRLQTTSLVGDSQTADHLNIGIGVLF
jgi:hypothetical protein